MPKSFFNALLTACLVAVGCFLTIPALAQTPTAPPLPKAVQIQGKTLDGQPYNLSVHKGKVVLVMFWATDCAICRDKMHELRDNAKGWQGKPFTTLLISADRRMSDVESYNAIINASVPMKERLTQVWALDPTYKDNLGTDAVLKNRNPSTLPITLVIDKKGDVFKRYLGRIPAEVWDDIAELL